MPVAAGLKALVRSDIRVKLWGNLSFNPISALTGGMLEKTAGGPAAPAVSRGMMVEAQAIGEALGLARQQITELVALCGKGCEQYEALSAAIAGEPQSSGGSL